MIFFLKVKLVSSIFGNVSNMFLNLWSDDDLRMADGRVLLRES